MKYVKMFGPLAAVAAALMAFAGTASATLTNLSGNQIHGSNITNVILTGPVTINCAASTVGGEITLNNADHLEGRITTLTFSSCGSSTISVVQPGTLTATDSGANATTASVKSSGAEVTALLHNVLLGTRHCTYLTNNTSIGTLTESGHDPDGAGGQSPLTTAKFDISATIPIDPTTSDDICGEGAATWEGSYSVTNPDTLTID